MLSVSRDYDVVVIGAGLLGLGHAYVAHRRGLRVAVIEREWGIVGATVRNFGHICITPQDGILHELGMASRALWCELADRAKFWLREHGTSVVARSKEELALLESFAAERGTEQVMLLGARQVVERTPVRDDAVLGGAWLPLDLQVDPREAGPAIAAWLQEAGVDFLWGTAAHRVGESAVLTSRGEFRAGAVIVAVDYRLGEFYPDAAEAAELRRCTLSMLAAESPWKGHLETPLLTGWSMIRYPGVARHDRARAVQRRLAEQHPELAEIDLNQMYTQRPDGTLVIGDSHTIADAASPFHQERTFELLLEITKQLFGLQRIRITERWQGVCGAGTGGFVVHRPEPGVRAVSMATGVGMTVGLGLAEQVIGELVESGRAIGFEEGVA